VTFNERSVHPDLLEEEQAAAATTAEQTLEAPQRTRPRSSQRGQEATTASQESEPVPDGAGVASDGTQATPETPEWLSQAREAFDKDPAEAFKLLAKNLPRDQLEKDETLSGLIGHKADALLRRRDQEAIDHAKREAAQNNDLYTLGELEQRRIQQEQAIAQAQQQAASGGFMDGVVLFQQTLDRSIQDKVGGQTFGAGKSQAEGVAEYLQFLREEQRKLDRAEIERDVLRNHESAVRKSVLSEVNGDEPVPERDSGAPGRVREVTDEQIEAMTMREYDALFDENGHPKPGVRHRSTRGIPLTRR
jgi:hypothetical protein